MPSIAFSGVKVGIGIKGGYNLVTANAQDLGVLINENFELVNKSGYTFGVPIEISIIDFFAIQPEIHVSIKGLKGVYQDTVSKYTMDETFRFVEVPILFKFTMPLKTVSPFLFVGPAVSVRVGVDGLLTKENPDTVYEFSEEEKSNLRSHTKPISMSVAFGTGVNIKAGPGKFTISYKYTLGVTNMAKLNLGDVLFTDDYDDPQLTFGTSSFMAGYIYSFGKD